jgi:hypothetical protein
MEDYRSCFWSNQHVEDLTRLFKHKLNQPRLDELNEKGKKIYEGICIACREYQGLSKESPEYKVPKAREVELRQEMAKIRMEEMELNTDCPAWLEPIESDDFLMYDLILKFFLNSRTLKKSEIELQKYAEKMLNNISKGGYFQEGSFLKYGNPCIEKLTDWFNEFPEFLEYCESDDLYEFGKENAMPTRMTYEFQLLSFPWYKERNEIPSYGEELARLKTIVETNKTTVLSSVSDLITHIKDTYFPIIDIFTMADEINEIRNIGEKKARLYTLYHDDVLCPTKMHKVLLSLFVDPFGTHSGVLIESVL